MIEQILALPHTASLPPCLQREPERAGPRTGLGGAVFFFVILSLFCQFWSEDR